MSRESIDDGTELLQIPGQRMRVLLERSAEVIARDGVDRTFSAEAVEGIGTKVQQWILSRLWRKHKFEKISAHSMEVEITVKLDGESIDVLTVPLTIQSLDGGHRWRALGGN